MQAKAFRSKLNRVRSTEKAPVPDFPANIQSGAFRKQFCFSAMIEHIATVRPFQVNSYLFVPRGTSHDDSVVLCSVASLSSLQKCRTPAGRWRSSRRRVRAAYLPSSLGASRRGVCRIKQRPDMPSLVRACMPGRATGSLYSANSALGP
jgi:hypothetical protein